MATEKSRLDQLLVTRGLASSREKAQALILAGQVLVNDSPLTKAGEKVPSDVPIRLRGKLSPFVGRGGEKLQGALDHFQLNLSGQVALDVGASTGGFTDCMLQSGAVKVYAIDVGHNQLDQKLRADSRVVSLEGTHAKDLERDAFDPLPTFATIDVSFISVRTVLDYTIPLLREPYQILLLVKPQFEVGREQVGKGGVVRDEKVQREAVDAVLEHGRNRGLTAVGSAPSVLRGSKKGNQEYFVLFQSAARAGAQPTD
ncbi:MAG: TlyA family RNA methyltransferase [Bdellovibrionota bacterium]